VEVYSPITITSIHYLLRKSLLLTFAVSSFPGVVELCSFHTLANHFISPYSIHYVRSSNHCSSCFGDHKHLCDCCCFYFCSLCCSRSRGCLAAGDSGIQHSCDLIVAAGGDLIVVDGGIAVVATLGNCFVFVSVHLCDYFALPRSLNESRC
jgi:hypothetical protein